MISKNRPTQAPGFGMDSSSVAPQPEITGPTYPELPPVSEKRSNSVAKSSPGDEKEERTPTGPIFPDRSHSIPDFWDEAKSFDPETSQKCLEDLSEIVSEFSKKYPLHTHRIPVLRDSEDPLVAFVRTMVQSMAKTEEKLIELNQQALSAARAKEQFLANLSHEVRTPMNGIFGMVRHLLDTDLDQTQRDYLETVESSSELLLNLLNDVLDVSKLNTNELKLRPRSFSLFKLLKEIDTLYEPLASARGNHFKLVVSDDVPDYLVGDDLRLKQILSNLISNANKFTLGGKITLSVELGPTRNDTVNLRFFVKDTGCGIPHSAIETLFDPFTRVENSTTRKTEGTGLGLAICRNLIYLMKGEITVDSTPGEGSTFQFYCHLEIGASLKKLTSPMKPAGTSKNAPNGNDKKLKVLVVDDKKVNQKVADIGLTRMGCEVSTAADGVEAVKAACGEDVFDVICMDVCMPNMDGIEATRLIRNLVSPNSNSRILGMTGLASVEDHNKCREAGMDSVITKPIDFRRVRDFIENSGANTPLSAELNS